MSRHALVTGATGGLGRSLVPALLAQGYAVRAVGRNAQVGAELSGQGAHFAACDLTQPLPPTLLSGIDVVFHLAALSSPWGAAENFEAINVSATQALCDAGVAAGVEAFVFTSTPSIFAASRDRLGITEADPHARPFANDYARTKYAAEQIVLAANPLKRIILRPRAIVGPHDTVLLPRLMAALERPVMPLPDGGRALIELTDVRDVVSALIAADAARDAADGLAINISGGQPLALRDILSRLSDKLGLPIRTLNAPTSLLAGVSYLLQGAAKLHPRKPEPALTPYTVKTLAYSQTFDLSRATSVLNWQPLYTPDQAIDAALEGRTA